jgi:hypothetical protein
MKLRIRHVVLGAIATIALALPASASAALVGPRDLDVGGNAIGCLDPDCTYANLSLADGKVRSPIAGTITKWRVYVHPSFDPGPIHLQVLRRTVNEAGVTDDKFKAVRESAEETGVPTGKQDFLTSLPIRKGDFIGVTATFGGATFAEVDNLGGKRGLFVPALEPGGGGAMPFSAQSDSYVLFNATVKD